MIAVCCQCCCSTASWQGFMIEVCCRNKFVRPAGGGGGEEDSRGIGTGPTR